MKSYLVRIFFAVSVLLFVLCPGMPAFAHVHVEPENGKEGDNATLVFRVPNERNDASTVKIDIQIPENATFTTVTTVETEGWTITSKKNSKRISRVTYEGGEISGNSAEEFTIVVGPLPHEESLLFKTLQTYDDGEVVRWIDVDTGNRSDHSDRPAPFITIETLATTSTSASDEAITPATSVPKSQNEKSDDTSSTLLVGLGLLAAMIAGAVVYVRIRKRTR